MRLLVLGGIRSGKSARAESAAAATGHPVVYVATARRDPDDAEMAERIASHRRRRPEDWTTVESADLPEVLAEHPEHTVLVDDLGGWLAHRLDLTLGWTSDSPEVDRDVDRLIDAVRSHPSDLVVVSPEVGMGIVPASRSGRVFADLIGEVNRRLAEVCDRTELVVAGRVVTLSGAPSADSAVGSADTVRQASAPPAAAPPAVVAGVTGSTATTADRVPAVPATAPAPTTDDAGSGDDRFPGLRDVDHYADPTVFDPVRPPSHELADQARARQLELTKPAGSLGRLEELSVWITSCQQQCPPAAIDNPRVVVFAGDHGIAANGVSAFPQEVTPQMVSTIISGGAAINVLARQAGAGVRVADIAVAVDCDPSVTDHKVRRSSGPIDREDALSDLEVRAAIAAGRRIADEEVDAGADLLVAGDLGIGNTTPATVLTCLFTGKEPVALVGRGTGVDDEGWIRKTAAIRDAMYRGRDDVRDPVSLLRRVGGADLAAMAGFLAQSAIRRTPVLLDGSVVTAAALVAETMAPGARQWWRAGHRSAEPSHTAALAYLALEPIVDYQMRLGEGSGAVTALPVVRSAVAVLREMATFADAGVSDKD